MLQQQGSAALPRQFSDDVDFLLTSSSRKAAISRESESQRGLAPGTRLRRRGRKAGRFMVRLCVLAFPLEMMKSRAPRVSSLLHLTAG